MIFHFALSQEIFSCETKKLFFPVTQGVLPVTGFVPPLAMNIHPMCTNSTFPVTRTIFLVRENSFVIKFGSSYVYHIFATNVWDLQSKFPVRPYDFVGTWFPGSP